MTVASEAVVDDDKIVCRIDGARVHSIHMHIKNVIKDPAWTIERYKSDFKGAPLLSALAQKAVLERKAEITGLPVSAVTDMKSMAELFGFPAAKTMNARGQPIMTQVILPETLDEEDRIYLLPVDNNYVFNIELTKNALIALGLNMPALFWGYHGTGKTTMWEQTCARTGRPFMRVQHTINTEEAHILGQYLVKDGQTVWSPGPLQVAMQRGYVYCADEYDVALPAVIAVYQPVLEGKSLIIKEAPSEQRVIKPHPNFRFVATGNTNGCGDETGLYQGTQIQNAAAYSRFRLTEEVQYMEPKVEEAVIMNQSGARKEEAGKLVNFAQEVRKSFKGGQISSTLSPRELINAAILGLVRGGDWRGGLRLAFSNRLSRTDREVCEQFAQRIFG